MKTTLPAVDGPITNHPRKEKHRISFTGFCLMLQKYNDMFRKIVGKLITMSVRERRHFTYTLIVLGFNAPLGDQRHLLCKAPLFCWRN
jgi:hypothetical protein